LWIRWLWRSRCYGRIDNKGLGGRLGKAAIRACILIGVNGLRVTENFEVFTNVGESLEG
jgi:hypothetical protein